MPASQYTLTSPDECHARIMGRRKIHTKNKQIPVGMLFLKRKLDTPEIRKFVFYGEEHRIIKFHESFLRFGNYKNILNIKLKKTTCQ